MSKAGRLQDALHDQLWGYTHGMTGEFFPGLLHGKFTSAEVADIRHQIEETVWMVMG